METNDDKSEKAGDDNVVLTQYGTNVKETNNDDDFWIFIQVGQTMTKSKLRHGGMNDNCFLLDSQSNCDIFRNKEYLTDLHQVEGPGLTIHFNGGEMST